jgi:hypothetical protein
MTRIRAQGLTADVPPGWDLRIGKTIALTPEAGRHALLHASTRTLPGDRGDFGSGVVEQLSPSDIFVVLFEYGASSVGQPLFASTTRPWPLDGSSFSPTQLQRTLPGQAGVQRFFTSNGRAFCVYVVLGAWFNRDDLTARVNQLLVGLQIEPTASRAGR